MPKSTNSNQKKRPTGVTVLAVLYILFALLLLGGGGVLLSARSYLGTQVGSVIGTFGGVLGGVLIVAALIMFVISYGFLKGNEWSWWVAIIFLVLGLISEVASLFTGQIGAGIIGIIISAIIIYYLTRPNVKKWFK
jgi:hypothetical protein